MKRLVVPIALAFAFSLVPYVRRGVPGRPALEVVVVGSRDRALAGKARRRARRASRAEVA